MFSVVKCGMYVALAMPSSDILLRICNLQLFRQHPELLPAVEEGMSKGVQSAYGGRSCCWQDSGLRCRQRLGIFIDDLHAMLGTCRCAHIRS